MRRKMNMLEGTRFGLGTEIEILDASKVGGHGMNYITSGERQMQEKVLFIRVRHSEHLCMTYLCMKSSSCILYSVPFYIRPLPAKQENKLSVPTTFHSHNRAPSAPITSSTTSPDDALLESLATSTTTSLDGTILKTTISLWEKDLAQRILLIL